MVDKVQLPKDAELAKQVLVEQSKERGMLGHIFGTKEHAPNNIAALALLLVVLLLVAAMFAPLDGSVNRGAFITTLVSAITFIIGIIFGRRIDE